MLGLVSAWAFARGCDASGRTPSWRAKQPGALGGEWELLLPVFAVGLFLAGVAPLVDRRRSRP